MKIYPIKPAIETSLVVNGHEFIFTTNYNHLHFNKKFFTLTHKESGKYLGTVVGKAHAKTIAKLFLTGDEPLNQAATVAFLTKAYDGRADFENAKSGTVYMFIQGKKIRISNHDTGSSRAMPDLDLPANMNRKELIRAIEALLK